jgi:hypothetical protein
MKKLITLSILLAAQIAANAQTARVQVIHNCADGAADTVDVYLNGTKLLSSFAFRTATPFIDAPAGVPLTLGVAPNHSASVMDTIYSTTVTLTASGEYVVVADGIVSASGYTPGSATTPFRLSVYDMARETATTSGQTDVLVEHGATDAPTVEVEAGSSVLVSGLSFGNFCSTGYLNLPTANDTLYVTNSTGSSILYTYSAPLATLNLADSAITVLASGFVDSAANSNRPSFGLWVALREGGALIPLPKLENPTSVESLTNNSAAQVFPNPVSDYLNVVSAVDLSRITIMDITGRVVTQLNGNKQARIDVSNLSQGIYMVRLETINGEVSTKKIIKE